MSNAIIPALCPNCGLLFRSRALAISGNVKNLTLKGNTESCPSCGGRAQIADGVFDVADGALSIVRAPHVTREMLSALEAALKLAMKKKSAPEQVAQEVEKIDPSFGKYVRKLGEKPSLYTAALILTIAAIHSCSMKVEVKLDANTLVDQIVNAPIVNTVPEDKKQHKPPGLGKNYTLRNPE